MTFSIDLHLIPKKLRGEKAAEPIVKVKLLLFGIDSERRNEKRDTDLKVFRPLTKGTVRVPVQVKSSSLAFHDEGFHVDDTSLESFRGWYIVLVERKPNDDFYYIPDDKLRRYVEENKDNKKKVRPDPKRPRKYVRIMGNEADFEEYLKPDPFVEAVLGIPMEKLPDWLDYLNGRRKTSLKT